jgi:hypothetical protein
MDRPMTGPQRAPEPISEERLDHIAEAIEVVASTGETTAAFLSLDTVRALLREVDRLRTPQPAVPHVVHPDQLADLQAMGVDRGCVASEPAVPATEAVRLAERVLAAEKGMTPGPWNYGPLFKDMAGDYVIWQGKRKRQCECLLTVGGLSQPCLPPEAAVLFQVEENNARGVCLLRTAAPDLARAIIEMAGRIERAVAGIDGLLSNLNPGEPVPVTKRQMVDLRAILAGDERRDA